MKALHWLFHWWVDRDPPESYVVWRYQFCAYCDARRALRVAQGHQPRDTGWLNYRPAVRVK